MNCEINNDNQYTYLSYKAQSYEADITLVRKESRTKSMDNLKPDNLNL
jgi:hypothetical protein